MQLVARAAHHRPEHVDREHKGREKEERPEQRCGAQSEESQRNHQAERGGRIAHEEDLGLIGESGGLLDLQYGGAVVGVCVGNDLTTGCPEADDVAAVRIIPREQQDRETEGKDGEDKSAGEDDRRFEEGSNLVAP